MQFVHGSALGAQRLKLVYEYKDKPSSFYTVFDQFSINILFQLV